MFSLCQGRKKAFTDGFVIFHFHGKRVAHSENTMGGDGAEQSLRDLVPDIRSVPSRSAPSLSTREPSKKCYIKPTTKIAYTYKFPVSKYCMLGQNKETKKLNLK